MNIDFYVPAQGSQEWKEWRRTRIGASDVPIIMGISPWKTPRQLYFEKIEGTEQPMTPAMIRGMAMEDKARDHYELLSGRTVIKQTLVSEERPYMIASFDGLTMCCKYAVEIKCPGESAHKLAIDGIIPEYYLPQLQAQMYVGRLESIDYFSYRDTGILIECERDDEYIKEIVKKVDEFYSYLTSRNPPPMTDRDYTIRYDDRWYKLSDRYTQIDTEIKKLESEKEQIRKELIIESSEMNSSGNGISVTKFMRKGRIIYEQIPELKEVDLEKHREPPTESWIIRIDKP